MDPPLSSAFSLTWRLRTVLGVCVCVAMPHGTRDVSAPRSWIHAVTAQYKPFHLPTSPQPCTPASSSSKPGPRGPPGPSSFRARWGRPSVQSPLLPHACNSTEPGGPTVPNSPAPSFRAQCASQQCVHATASLPQAPAHCCPLPSDCSHPRQGLPPPPLPASHTLTAPPARRLA